MVQTRIPVAVATRDTEFTDDIRGLLDELRQSGVDVAAGECAPPLDVYESDDALVIKIDVPGVDAAEVRVLMRGAAVVIVGAKAPRRSRGDASYHLVERGFGRFARIVRLATPCDARQARAILAAGELSVTLPKIRERRGQAIPVPVAGS